MITVEKLGSHIAGKLIRNVGWDEECYYDLKYGLEIILQFLLKNVIIYGTAWSIGMLKETFIFQAAFNLVRNRIGSVHSKTSLGCSIWSFLLILFLKYFPEMLVLNGYIFLLSAVILITVTLHLKMDRNSIFFLLTLFSMSYFVPVLFVSKAIYLSIMLSTILLVPTIKQKLGMV